MSDVVIKLQRNPQNKVVKIATGIPGVGIPTGGTTNQVLAKLSNANYETQWITPTGGSTLASRIITTNSTMLTTDGFVLGDSVSGVTLTLLDATEVDGFYFFFKNISTGDFNIVPVLSQLIDDHTDITLKPFQAITLLSKGGIWWIF